MRLGVSLLKASVVAAGVARSWVHLILLGAFFGLTGCVASVPDEPDLMCPAIAAFANASKDSTIRSVELINDWSCNFYKGITESELDFGCKGCKHEDYVPAKELCSYLMENTSTEFSYVNFKRVLDCLNTANNFSLKSPSSAERLSNRPIWSDHAELAKPRIVIGVEYLTNVLDSPPILKISARKGQ
jgi:hypothetical protein